MMALGSWTKSQRSSVHVALIVLIFIGQLSDSQARYLPTRNYGDNIDKLRELMLQILDSSYENSQQSSSSSSAPSLSAQQQQRASMQRSDHSADGLLWNKDKYADILDSSSLSSSSAIASSPLRSNDRFLRSNNGGGNKGYDSSARLNFLLKHPHRFLNNLDQLM